MKKRILILALALIMCFPITALAAEPGGQWDGSLSIGDMVVIENGEIVGEFPEGMSWDESGILTFENLKYSTQGQALRAEGSLTLALKGENKLTAGNGIEVVDSPLRITGDGSLALNIPNGTPEEAFMGFVVSEMYVLDDVTLSVNIIGGHRSFAIYCLSSYCQLRGDVSVGVAGADRGFGILCETGGQIAVLGGSLTAEVNEGIAVESIGLAADRGLYEPLVLGKFMDIAQGGSLVAGPDYNAPDYEGRLYDCTFSESGELTIDPTTSLTLGTARKVALTEDSPTNMAVAPTTQGFTVNGAAKEMEIYNIDGSNYFKLRDVAYVLQNTSADFAVDYSAELRAMDVDTDSTYEPVGGECAPGVDKSDSVVPSSQSFRVDGRYYAMTAFNIGGNNFFRLRDLGDALGFSVDYDDATRTMLVTTE